MGTRLMAHLEDNVKALGLDLPEELAATLNDLTPPQLPFPLPFLQANAQALHQGGTTVNGHATELHIYSPKDASETY